MIATGGVAGAIAKTVAAPLERVKLIIQCQDANPKIRSGEMERYKGMVDCFKRVYSEEGLAAFWRGNLPNVARYFPVAAFNFAFKDSIKALFPAYDHKAQFLAFFVVNLLSGGLAGGLSLTLVYPLDYARTRLAADVSKRGSSPQFEGLGDCIMQTVTKNGPFALYKGYFISVVGIIVYRGAYFGLFDTLQGLNPFHYTGGGLSWYLLALLSAFINAQLVSIIAGFVSYPIDTVRRRLQMEASMAQINRVYRGACHCAHVILTTEGCSAIFKGFLANVWRGALTSVMLVIYREVTVHVFHIA